MLYRMHLIAAACAAAALFAVTMPEQADAQGTAAATAASICGQPVAASYRSLSSANGISLHKLCNEVGKSLTTVSFFDHHRLLIAPRYKTWWAVPDKKWRLTVRKAREVLRLHQQILAQDVPLIQHLSFSITLERSFMCIKSYEGDWTANTGNGYYGGLQMDDSFMSSYGPEFLARYGTADKWPIWAQLVAGERAYASGRGFGPWPNTARYCHFSTAPVTPTPELVSYPMPALAL